MNDCMNGLKLQPEREFGRYSTGYLSANFTTVYPQRFHIWFAQLFIVEQI